MRLNSNREKHRMPRPLRHTMLLLLLLLLLLT